MADDENPWAADPLQISDHVENAWSTSTSYRPQYVENQDLLDSFDPLASPKKPSEPIVDKPPSKLEPQGGLLSQPLLPSLSLSSITNVFRRVTPTVSPAPSPVPPSTPADMEKHALATDLLEQQQAQAGPSSPRKAKPTVQLDTSINDDDPESAPFDFSKFKAQMHSRSAEPIVKYYRSFLREVQKRQWRTADQIRVINDFLDFIAEKMRTNEIWRHASDQEFDNAIEGMEKLVMNHLYDYTFTPALAPEALASNPTDDLERDQVLTQRIKLFAWVTEAHLDLPTDLLADDPDVPNGSPAINLPARTISSRSAQIATKQMSGQREPREMIQQAQAELLRINQYTAPRDKLICVLNCCTAIFNMIRTISSGQEGGADTFIPYLILVILKACPDHLVSNIQYIQRFRNPDKLQGEAGYYLQSLTGAISFIETMDHSSLSNIGQDEFEHYMEQAICEMEPDLNQPNSPVKASFDAPQSTRDLPAVEVLPADHGSSNLARDFFDRSANLASITVSKPLNAIGQIFTELGRNAPIPSAFSRTADPLSPDTARRKRGYANSVQTGSPPSSPGQASNEASDYVPDDSSPAALQAQIDEATQLQNANLQTLAQMFPDIEGEVREVILLSFQNDLGAAVDALVSQLSIIRND